MREAGGGEESPLGGDRQVLRRREAGHRAGVGAPGAEAVTLVPKLNGDRQKSPDLHIRAFYWKTFCFFKKISSYLRLLLSLRYRRQLSQQTLPNFL